ncbi:L-lactate dehydrogenase [Tepidimicrobium xylanilyticum]|uniref:L-lactate dehydrogenase n=1 Tax=Tepidimicrobium xylanilyticum TaxID=1123352 RepID=A0A1H3ED46_9FIRM|nr:L-lactate dehydrogenase [Tepidimicrobium xylanilyticum]GMG96581.1 L-lactate dehydrogenase [Tepidimicrobium xylanilyticum]SDX76530.1 L-lactate dehydrogenase [Tepidimicrobium xylanilyticum]
MGVKNRIKISILGGGGAVGSTTAYAVAIAGLANELVLVDINKDKTEGEALDLSHGAAFIEPVDIRVGEYEDTKDSDIVIITAGLAQKSGETRLQLTKRNIEIFKTIIPEVIKYSPNSILLVISNPVDILTYVAYRLSGFPRERVIGSGTVLDTSRLKYEISNRFNVDPRDVTTYILGEHGDTGFPVWSLTNIKGIKIDQYAQLVNMKYNDELKKDIHESVKNAAYEIINKKGATFYAIALSATHIVESILRDKKSILPVSALVNNYYDANDIYLGVPCIVGRNGVEKVLNVQLNEEEINNFNKSARVLKTALNESFLLSKKYVS